MIESNLELDNECLDVRQDNRIGDAQKRFGSFSIGNLLFLTAVTAVSCLPIMWHGAEYAFYSFLIFLVGFGYLIIRQRNFSLKEVSIAIAIIGLILLLMPNRVSPLGTLDRAAKRATCLNNIRQLVLACHNYQSGSLQFPPPFSTDSSGRPLHSWRVLILPYIEEQDLYDDLDLTKPWDHPDNLKHAHRMPRVFQCQQYVAGETDRFANVMTSYIAVIGEETVWHPTKRRSFDDVWDGASNTIMFIESDVHRVHWMSPNDLRFDELTAINPRGDTNLLTSQHAGGAQVAFVDGSAWFVSSDVKLDDIKACLTIKGREQTSIVDR